ncbi:MAG: glycerol kinase 2 [Planctomycetaceae bacterium]|nr:MAG: glycerol kinase 2 [Planctomycetaceae bacterium]
MSRYILALDQGTTSSRAIVFHRQGEPVAMAQQEFPQHFPRPGHVVHDPEEIWSSVCHTAREALARAGGTARDLAAIGVTNQRETTLVWDRRTGKPWAPAIVWQSRISQPICERWQQAGYESLVRQKTGLTIDPYFSASKLVWLLEQVEGLRAAAERGEALFGTVDTFLIWRLTGGRCHLTDASNASRTLLYNIHTGAWDEELLRLFKIPAAMLPEVRDSSSLYGTTAAEILGHPVMIAGVAGDQQAATFGQTCFTPGLAKNTYGTGCFLLMNTGERPISSQRGLLTTVAWQLQGKRTYALEGAVFVAGAALQWLRDGLGIIASAAESEALAASVEEPAGVYFVPALAGLGAPYWDPEARGLIIGLTRGTTRAQVVRAALEAMAYQTRDVLDTMVAEAEVQLTALRVDGGATANRWLMQFQADQLGVPVYRSRVQETTALGAAYLAGLAVGYWDDLHDISRNWSCGETFRPLMTWEQRETLYQGWQQAVARCRQWARAVPNQRG